MKQYYLDIDNTDGVNFVALVDKPAIERDFIAFEKVESRFKIQNEEKRILAGALMIPDMPIFRRNEVGEEFEVIFSKDVVKKIAMGMMKKGYQNNVNLMHDPKQVVEGVNLFQFFISDEEIGVQPLKGFEDTPQGTLFGIYKVDNDQVWQDVKDGKFKGFSVEGTFEMIDVALLKMGIEECLNTINNKLCSSN